MIDGRLAQWLSARSTSMGSQVWIQVKPSVFIGIWAVLNNPFWRYIRHCMAESLHSSTLIIHPPPFIFALSFSKYGVSKWKWSSPPSSMCSLYSHKTVLAQDQPMSLCELSDTECAINVISLGIIWDYLLVDAPPCEPSACERARL